MNKLFTWLGLALVAANACADKPNQPQVVEREKPAQWKELVPGGRFMDLFLPMPDLGGMASATWGDTNVVPRDINNGIEDPQWSYWGGNTALGPDGKYHLMVARWPEDAPKGHMSWPDSEVAHVVSDSPFGPFEVKRIIGPGHNPTWYVARDGTYVLYVIDGRYTAKSLDGPWERSEYDFNSRDRKDTKQKNYLANCSFAQREDGSYFMLNRHGQAWFSRDGISEFGRVTNDRVYPPVEGKFEDPVVWRDNVQYHLIVNDWLGRIAWYLRSKDGVNWKVDPGEAYEPGIAVHADGTKEDWFKYERIRILQDEHGRACAANFAVIDVLKHDDLTNDNHSSKLIVIPLTVGRLLTVLDNETITPETKAIRVKVAAEDGFDPHTDIDLDSLRFGAPEEVDYGRGSKLQNLQRDGEDLVLVFDGQGNGFTDKNFAGKLLGKTTDGKLLFGWSRIPGVEYIEPVLSARLPVFLGSKAMVEVQNFGQVESEDFVVKVFVNETEVGSATASALVPFETTIVQLDCSRFKPDPKAEVTVRIQCSGHPPFDFTRTMNLKHKGPLREQ